MPSKNGFWQHDKPFGFRRITALGKAWVERVVSLLTCATFSSASLWGLKGAQCFEARKESLPNPSTPPPTCRPRSGPSILILMSAPLLLGHRGSRATKSIPENTIPSFDLALEHGCDGFEFDVRRTADGRAVICYDPQFGGVEIAAAVANQLRDVLTLEQVLSRYRTPAFLDIELKVSGLEQQLLEALETHPPKKGFVVSSFLPGVLLSL